MTKEYSIEELDCAVCASKVEGNVSRLPGVRCANANLFTKKLSVTVEDQEPNDVWNTITKVIQNTEPSAILLEIPTSSAPALSITPRTKSSSNHRSLVPIRILIVSILLGITFLLPQAFLIFLVSFAAYVISGYDVIYRALKNTFKGQVFDENFLMTVATIGAFAIGEFPEAVAVMAFYQIGEYFQDRAVDNSRRSIAALMDIRPETATVLRDGKPFVLAPEQVAIGEIIRIRPGERIPLDATVSFGSSSIDTKALTGESLPRSVTIGDELISGCVNLTGLLEATVSKTYGDSTVSRILSLVESSAGRKSKTEQFITAFARFYTPIVVIAALLLAFIPPVFIPGATLDIWLYRALVFLVISCPCALVISVPLGFFAGIGASAKIGVLVKGGNHLHALANVKQVVFDKTGTLTKGVFSVQQVKAQENSGFSEDTILAYAASVEHHSNHPIARSIVRAAKSEYPWCESIQELSGFGVTGIVEGKKVIVGNRALFLTENIPVDGIPSQSIAQTEVMVAVDGQLIGAILISDTVKEEAKEALRDIRSQGVERIVMLTGDNPQVAEAVARAIGIDEFHSQLLPQDKVEKVEFLLASKSVKEKLLFVGDGVNDAPVIARADIGMAMGALGSDAAIEAADVVIMTDDLSRIGQSIAISKKTLRIVKQNIVFALAIKIFVLGLGALGLASMWAAVFADTGVAFLAILNSLRVLGVGKKLRTRL